MKKQRLYLILILISIVLISSLIIFFNVINSHRLMTDLFIKSSENITNSFLTSILNKIDINKSTEKIIEDSLIYTAKLIEKTIKNNKSYDTKNLNDIIESYPIEEIFIIDKDLEIMFTTETQNNMHMHGGGEGKLRRIKEIVMELFSSDSEYITSSSMKGWRGQGQSWFFAYRINNSIALILKINEDDFNLMEWSSIYDNQNLNRLLLPSGIVYSIIDNKNSEEKLVITRDGFDYNDGNVDIRNFNKTYQIKTIDNIEVLVITKNLNRINSFDGVVEVGIDFADYRKFTYNNLMNSIITAVVFITLLIGVIIFLIRLDRADTISKASEEKYKSLVVMSNQVAHEIKNPLNSLSMLAKRIDMGINKGTLDREYVKKLYERIDDVNNVINDFSMITKPIKPIKENVNLNKFILDITDSLEIQYPNISIEKDIQNINFDFDRNMIKQALYNILINSIEELKGNGYINIKSFRKNDHLFFKISDNGKGVSDDIIENLFTPFYTSKANGHGLGLAIVKKIIEAHNGKIILDKKNTSGALFIINIPTT